MDPHTLSSESRFDDAWRGVFGAPQTGSAACSSAWGCALDAHRYHAGLAQSPPSLDSIPATGTQPERSGALFAASLVGRASMLSFDRPGFDAATALADSLATQGVSERAALYRRVMHGWRHVLDGTSTTACDLETLAADCSRARVAELVIEANVLRALSLLRDDELAEATALARRVSRMARTEGMPQQEYLAHVCLARVRRRAGHVHLATRILSSLEKVAPPVWRQTLDWQLRLAGRHIDGNLAPTPFLNRLVAASIQGDEGAFIEHRDRLRDSLRGFAAEAADASLVAAAIDPRIAANDLDPSLVPWASGVDERLPAGLHSVVATVGSPHTDLAGHSWVYVAPSVRARRFLHPGIGLTQDCQRMESTRRRHGRTELATAVLALAGGDGIRVSKFVSRVYGFSYSEQAHDGVLRVLLHRMRKNLDGVATIVREDDRLKLAVLAAFIVPDPRTSPPSSEHILRAIAANPGTSAKGIAKALAVPLRTVQAALSSLVADGACMAERVGPAVEYRLEDTTFSEPTTMHSLPEDDEP